jgi:carbonic anhydrase/acetyltransferase-like protein (isoleucine patch superfamily)
MPIYEFEGRRPTIAPSAYVASTAVIIGEVIIGGSCYVGHGAILRGDYGRIEVGDGTAVEEGVIVHARPGGAAVFGARVTLGHGAMIHNATVEAEAVIGMRATVSNDAVVGRGAIVGEAALVKNGQRVSPDSVAVGVPCRVIGPVSAESRERWARGKELYIGLAGRYPAGLVRIDR